MGKGVWFAIGAAGAAVGVYYFLRKVQVPNAYALGQANPTLAYTALTPAQLGQLNTSPPLASPPPASTTIANMTNALAAADPYGTGTGTGTGGFRR